MKITQTFNLRIWNGKDYKAAISQEAQSQLQDLALAKIYKLANDGYKEGRFDLSIDSDDLFYCAGEADTLAPAQLNA